MLCPSTKSLDHEARAAEGDVPASAGGDSLSIAISNSKINLATDPTVENGVVQSTLDISAKTTNTTGYALKLNTSGTTSMKSTDSAITATIQSLSSNATLANLPANRWGYYIGDAVATASSTFRPFSTTAVEIDSTSAANSTLRTKKLTIAAKIDTSLPASTYSARVTISVVTKPPLIDTLNSMQEMTSSICAYTPTGHETQLRDSRDDQMYWVGKMKDGKCWMLQNLALGSTTETIALTSSDSNVASNWELPEARVSAANGSSQHTWANVWNFGKYVLATPEYGTSGSSCGRDATALSSCVKAGFVDVSDETKFQPTYTAKTGAWQGYYATDSTLVAVDCTSWSGSGSSKRCTAGTYDAHYLVGNYYNWSAATAETGSSTAEENSASSSICPKGWRLPTGNSGGELYRLLSAYGISTSLAGSSYNISGPPLRFVKGGRVETTSFYHPGWYGGYLSSTANSVNGNISGRILSISDEISLASYATRHYGYSVRCVAQ